MKSGRYFRIRSIAPSNRQTNAFFPGTDTKGLEYEFWGLKRHFDHFSYSLPGGADAPLLVKLTSNLGLGQDSSLFFSEVRKGMDLSMDEAVRDLAARLIHKYDSSPADLAIPNPDYSEDYFAELELLGQEFDLVVGDSPPIAVTSDPDGQDSDEKYQLAS